jgi:hypothetical protein
LEEIPALKPVVVEEQVTMAAEVAATVPVVVDPASQTLPLQQMLITLRA